MGSRWGINRTVAQIHALLYISPRALTAEEISETLAVARSTVSTGLRELQSWGLIKIVHVLGDRRDHFEIIGDVWEMFRAVLDERKRRELDPALSMLRETVSEFESSNGRNPVMHEKMIEMLDFFETATEIYDQFQKLPTETLVQLAKKRDTIRKILNLTSGA
ncbi:MAG: MarR family transcriptional regulator [Anaerolineales bacterium]|nr:MarR family transcriptional regulator [Chloroflexota bacterium]MBL6983649.1 MarR family transcriptional regulator [Anaerolineales bacterium]